MPTKSRKSYMSAEEFRALRQSADLTPRALSYLLDCGEQSIRNMESGDKPVGKQMALLLILMAHPMVRALLPSIFQYKETVLKKSDKEREKAQNLP